MILNRPRNLTLCAIVSTLIVGCAGDSTLYPSLGARAAETATGAITPDAPTAPAPITAADRARIGDLVAQARQSNQAFEAARPRAAALAGAAGGIESDSRARALVAIAGLSTLRGQTTIALGGLDELAAQAAAQSSDTSEIAMAQSQVAAMVSAQNIALASIEAVLR